MADIYLEHGLCAAYGGAPNNVTSKFFLATVQMVDRAVKEQKFEKDPHSNFGFPHNRAVALRAQVYAKAMLGHGLCVSDLSQASLDFETWCQRFTRRQWDSQGEANYLAGVRTAFLAGDRERFSSLLAHKWPFKWHAEEHSLYQAITEAFLGNGVIEDPALTAHFRSLFDTYRNPEFKPDIFLEQGIIRFEFGIIWCMLFNPGAAFDPGKIVEVVSA